MRRVHHEQIILRASLAAALGTVMVQSASAQVSFSIDNGSVSVGTPEAWGPLPITEGDILTPSMPGPVGPNPPMVGAPTPTGITVSAGTLGLFTHSGCAGHPAGTPCPIEVDALSYGTDFLLTPNHVAPDTYWFSVDEFQVGFPGPFVPSSFTEGAAGSSEAAADVFTDLGVSPAPSPPGVGPGGNAAEIDGNGLLSASGFVYPGVGLIEPIPAGTAVPVGDDLDAVDVDSATAGYPIYFSMDSAFIDPLTGIPLQGTAAVHGFSGADVLITPGPGFPPMVYAPAGALGLDLPGNGQDDLDALAIWENGVPGFQPAMGPYDWIGGPAGGGGSDMLLFSVRRGSSVIGMPDSLFGLPIEAGDILSTPIPTTLGGVSPFPSIWVAAENIGLVTSRMTAGHFGDELDALDVLCYDCGFPDCNGNGIPDGTDIGSGSSSDVNGNGIPDECELISTSFCFCTAAIAPCGNDYAAGGCENNTGVGAILTATGTGDVSDDDLFLHVTQASPGNFGLVFMGPAMIPPTPMGNGLRCIGGSLYRYLPIFITDAVGSADIGPMVSLSLAFPAAGNIVAVSTWNFQAWYRDPGGPCGANSNVTNALGITFTP